MIKKLLFIFVFIFSAYAFAQESMTFKDGKQYRATPAWNFMCENYALTGTANFQIAKADKGGVLQIAVQTTDASFFIGGTVYVDLEDHTVLVCTDKNMRKSADSLATAWYVFSANEINKLKTTNISAVRFYIKGTQHQFSSQTGNFTAINQKSYFKQNGNQPEIFETATQVSSLYQ